MSAFRLGEDRLTTAKLVELASSGSGAAPAVQVTSAARQRLKEFRAKVDAILSVDARVYGINTGFGFLANVAIEPAKLGQLQVNLVRSHACGVGAPVADEIVRALLVLRA